MSPGALAATRALAVLDFFTANSGRAFTLSELSAGLEINLASLSSVLRSLTDAGYLVRHPRHKTYELGPALVAAGQAAMMQHPVVELARREMQRLAEATGTECAGSVLVGNEIVILALEGRPSSRARGVALGHRLPLLPPFGQVFLAWSSAGTVDRWIARGLGERHEHLDRAHLLDALDQVAARGYAVNLSTPAIDRLKDTLSELTRHPRDQDLRARLPELVCALGDDYELLDEQPDRRYDVEMVSAPVFAADGSVTFAITMTGLAHRTGQEITEVAEQVAGAGLFVTRQIGGRMPAWVPGRRSA